MKEHRNSDYFNNNENDNGIYIPIESQKIIKNNNISGMNSLNNIPKIDLKNSTIPKINEFANMNVNLNIPNFNSVDRQKSAKNLQNMFQNDEAEGRLLENLDILLNELKNRKASFKDKSRLFCCGCFSMCMITVIFVFYIFDVMKYQETCNKTKKNYIEICDAPSIGFWPRFIFIAISSVLLIFSLYCTGPTIILFDPVSNKIFIDKKKIFCLPSICEYNIDDLLYAYIESDTTDGTPNLSNFSFYSVILVFKNDQINLGLGRDCFLINEKIQLVNKINRYLDAYRTDTKEYNTYSNIKNV